MNAFKPASKSFAVSMCASHTDRCLTKPPVCQSCTCFSCRAGPVSLQLWPHHSGSCKQEKAPMSLSWPTFSASHSTFLTFQGCCQGSHHEDEESSLSLQDSRAKQHQLYRSDTDRTASIQTWCPSSLLCQVCGVAKDSCSVTELLHSSWKSAQFRST